MYSIQQYVIKFTVTCGRSVVFSGYSGFLHNKTDRHNITEILLKVVLNTITLTLLKMFWKFSLTIQNILLNGVFIYFIYEQNYFVLKDIKTFLILILGNKKNYMSFRLTLLTLIFCAYPKVFCQFFNKHY